MSCFCSFVDQNNRAQGVGNRLSASLIEFRTNKTACQNKSGNERNTSVGFLKFNARTPSLVVDDGKVAQNGFETIGKLAISVLRIRPIPPTIMTGRVNASETLRLNSYSFS